MQSPLRTLVIGYRTGSAACQRLVVGGAALAAMAASALLPGSATAQRAGAEIGVSLTVIPSRMVQSATPVGFRVTREGSASIPSAPATTPGPHVVMSRLSSDWRGSVTASRDPALSCAKSHAGCAAHEIARRVGVGSYSLEDTVRVVRLGVEYFVVPGT